MRDSDKEALRARVEEILNADWDPLAVSDSSEVHGEYRTFSKGVVKLLLDGRDAFAIGGYLREAELGMLGGVVNERRIEDVVRRIMQDAP